LGTKEDMKNKIYKYLPLAMIGPIITTCIIWMTEGFTGAALLAGSVIAIVLILVTWLASKFVGRNPKDDTPITARIIGVSYLVAIGIVALFTLADKFFIIAILFAPVFATPTIISFAPFWSMILKMRNTATQ
jgi:hypothetical protein